jgi:feruloyl esterase
MDGWIKTGAAPSQVIARTAPPPVRPDVPAAPTPVKTMVRPVCAYPVKARYDGKGDPDIAASFSCR